MKEITEEIFTKMVGHPPTHDDLERCNCTEAGKIGHTLCGWNEQAHLPNFINSINSVTFGFTHSEILNLELKNGTKVVFEHVLPEDKCLSFTQPDTKVYSIRLGEISGMRYHAYYTTCSIERGPDGMTRLSGFLGIAPRDQTPY